MKTNLEKWNYYMSIIDNRTNEFVDSVLKDKSIPKSYFAVHPIGRIVERVIIGMNYSHNKNGFWKFFSGKKPTTADVTRAREYAESDIFFSEAHIYFNYTEKGDGFNLSSAVSLPDIINQKDIFLTIESAELKSNELKAVVEFKNLHKKDASYNYNANGYTFLGWQNGWRSEYYDEEGNLCSESGRPRVRAGYSKEKHPVYRNCIDLNHAWIEVQHDRRGSENTVSCPICMIYWKYDCSD